MCRLTVLLVAVLGVACAPRLECSPEESQQIQSAIGTVKGDEGFESRFDFDDDGVLTSVDFARYIQICRGDSHE